MSFGSVILELGKAYKGLSLSVGKAVIPNKVLFRDIDTAILRNPGGGSKALSSSVGFTKPEIKLYLNEYKIAEREYNSLNDLMNDVTRYNNLVRQRSAGTLTMELGEELKLLRLKLDLVEIPGNSVRTNGELHTSELLHDLDNAQMNMFGKDYDYKDALELRNRVLNSPEYQDAALQYGKYVIPAAAGAVALPAAGYGLYNLLSSINWGSDELVNSPKRKAKTLQKPKSIGEVVVTAPRPKKKPKLMPRPSAPAPRALQPTTVVDENGDTWINASKVQLDETLHRDDNGAVYLYDSGANGYRDVPTPEVPAPLEEVIPKVVKDGNSTYVYDEDAGGYYEVYTPTNSLL